MNPLLPAGPGLPPPNVLARNYSVRLTSKYQPDQRFMSQSATQRMVTRAVTLGDWSGGGGQRSWKKCLLMVLVLAAGLTTSSGCRLWNLRQEERRADQYPELPNPLFVPACDRDFAMDQVSDEVDDYFQIRREQRIALVDNVLMEGWIETQPKIGAGVFEPWRKDAATLQERRLGTLQTIRRWAKVRVIPDGKGYLIDVKVYKELEDRHPPDHSVVTSGLPRHDQSIDALQDSAAAFHDPAGSRLRWFSIGRDLALEQKMLRNIQSRLKKG